MINRNVRSASLSVVAGLVGLFQLLGCNTADEAVTDENMAALTACHLDDGTVEHNALIRSCDPQDTKKTTICHVPPGNPSNAHTLCIGNAAVPAHLGHHGGDTLGPCHNENRCPPPPGGGGDGAGGTCAHDGGITGAAGHAGGDGTGGGPGTVSTGGTTGGGTGGTTADAGSGIVIL